jgi:heme-degrading monooxygenase HmoA
MIQLHELDDRVSYVEQLQADSAGEVVLVNIFRVPPDAIDAFVQTWADDAAYMQRQRGYLDTQLHRAVGASPTFVNVATWESAGHLREAFLTPEFQKSLARYPDGTIATPHLFRKVAVPGICSD